jgi:hypothetical protein
LKSLIRFVTGIAVLVAAIAAFAPAALFDGALAAASQQRLRLVDATGPWWDGRGTVTARDGTARLPVRWRVDGAALLRGALVVRVADDDTGSRATILVASAGADVRDLHARVPAALLGVLDSRLRAVTLGGSIAVDAPSLTLAGDVVAGAVDARWSRARIVAGDAVVDLGTVSMTPDPSAQPATAKVSNTGGDVGVTGTIVDRADRREVDLQLRPSATTSGAARNALSMLGPADGPGSVRLLWRASR